MLDMPRQQQILDHVEDKQRLHRIIGKALAPFRESQIPQTLGMAEKGTVALLFEVGRRVCNGHILR